MIFHCEIGVHNNFAIVGTPGTQLGVNFHEPVPIEGGGGGVKFPIVEYLSLGPKN